MRRLPSSSLLVLLVWVATPGTALPFTLAGRVTDARTGEGIDRLPVSFRSAADTTRDGGSFSLVSGGSGRLVVDGTRRGFSAFLVEPFTAERDTILDIVLIPLGPLESSAYRDFLHFFTLMTGTGEPEGRAREDVSISYESSPRTTLLRRWERLPIRLHVPAREAQGFSWDAAIRRAAGEWERQTGLDLFEEVDAPSDADVVVEYGGHHSRVVFREVGPGGIPVRASLGIGEDPTTPEALASSAEHEFGHVLMILVHSEDPAHLMYWGGSRGRHVSEDEALVVRCLYGMPNFTDMRAYREEVPLSQAMINRKRVLTVVLIQVLLALFVVVGAR